MAGATPYGQLQYREVNGSRMAYVDEGEGDAIVFAHGNPTSSYLWRNVMPHLEGMGRLVAADMIGMGGSDKLSPSGPDRYNYAEQRDYLFALWDALDLGSSVTLVLHDWGSALGFDWASQHRDRVQAIAFMEAIVTPVTWPEFPSDARELFQRFRSPEGERLVLEQNIFVEGVLPGLIQRQLSGQEMDHYRQPFVSPGEDRRPTLSWPRNIPIDGVPAVAVVSEYSKWLAGSDVPKLFIKCRTGRDRQRPHPRAHPDMAQPGRDHGQRTAFHPGGLPGRDRQRHRAVRAEAAGGLVPQQAAPPTQEQASMFRRYIIWRNNHAHDERLRRIGRPSKRFLSCLYRPGAPCRIGAATLATAGPARTRSSYVRVSAQGRTVACYGPCRPLGQPSCALTIE